MTDILTNEEKLTIIAQHMRNLEFARYNAHLDLLQANAVLASDDALNQINIRIQDLDAKKEILEKEKQSLL